MFSGRASWIRISAARMPPSAKNAEGRDDEAPADRFVIDLRQPAHESCADSPTSPRAAPMLVESRPLEAADRFRPAAAAGRRHFSVSM